VGAGAVVGFETLLVIVLAGLGGPLLALFRGRFVPVVVGEIVAGVLVGPAVLDWLDPNTPTITLLGEVGFAMLMLTAGMHLPLRDPRLGTSLRTGAVLCAAVCVLSVPGGLLAAAIAGTGHAAIYAVILASGSAAVLLPALEEAHLEGPNELVVMAQVAIADLLTILAVPIVLQPGRLTHALLGGLLVAAAAALLLGATQLLSGREWVHRVRMMSKERHWALDLRMSLLILFALAWLAQEGGTSVLIAGFAAGIVVALRGGPKRLSTQMRGIADGFFVPLYFVVLGAHLDLGGVFSHGGALALVVALVALNAGIHLLVVALARRPFAGGLAAAAQLGVPAAVASLGLAEHLISSVTATAIVTSALLSLLLFTAGVDMLGRAHAPVSAEPAAAPR
jgi:Kef-type K+ transport system membrane component KefB